MSQPARDPRSDAEYILDSFTALRNRELRGHGEFRTKRGVMEAYNRMQEAIDGGRPYPPYQPGPTHDPTPPTTPERSE